MYISINLVESATSMYFFDYVNCICLFSELFFPRTWWPVRVVDVPNCEGCLCTFRVEQHLNLHTGNLGWRGVGGKEEVVNAKKMVAFVNQFSSNIGATFERGSEKCPSPGTVHLCKVALSCTYLICKIKVVLSCAVGSINPSQFSIWGSLTWVIASIWAHESCVVHWAP